MGLQGHDERSPFYCIYERSLSVDTTICTNLYVDLDLSSRVAVCEPV